LANSSSKSQPFRTVICLAVVISNYPFASSGAHSRS
jgi:hypothetical protein